MSAQLQVRPLRDDERGWLRERLTEAWGAPEVVSRGRLRDGTKLPALVAVAGDELMGVATYEVDGDGCELVTLQATRRYGGAGSALLEAVADEARRQGCARLWLITTNDNVDAMRFYQRRGLRLVAIRPNAMEEARRLKPAIPLVGEHGIPIRDEIELELELQAPEPG